MTASILLPGIEVQELHSQILGQELQLYVKLPWSYDRSDTTYPVLFCLDANRSFPLYSTASLILETPGTTTKEIVIVGVGYRIDSDRIRGLAQWAAWRTRDFTPVRSVETERFWKERLSALLGGDALDVQSGGAAKFLQSLREEIIPFVEANYRLASTDRGLAGYSDGGLFTLYALFHAPESFRRWFAGSPSMWAELFEYEEAYAGRHDDLRARLFITAGGHEPDVIEPMQRMVDTLGSRGYPGLEVMAHVFEGEGHASAMAASISRALCVLYNEAWLRG